MDKSIFGIPHDIRSDIEKIENNVFVNKVQ